MTIKAITRLKNSGPDKWQQLERFMPALTNVPDVYEKAKISVKILLDPPFAYNSLKAKEKGLLFVEQPLVSSGQNPFSSPRGKFLEHLFEFLEAIEPILHDQTK